MLHYRYIPHLLSSLLFGVCLLSLSCSGAYPAVTLGTNLVTNTGFESNTTGWTLGAGTARDTAVAHTGTSSIRLNGAATPTSVYVNNLSCLAGRKVKLTAWVKTLVADAASGGAVLEVKCFNTASRIIGSRRSTAVATNGAWQQIQLITLIPLNAATMRVTLLNTSQTASAWFDDINCTFPDNVQFRTLIRQPQYRQTVYSGQPRKIIVGAEVYDSISYPATSLAIRADLLDSSSSVIATALLKTIVNKSWQNIGISIPSSATGNLTVRTRLIVRSTEAVLKETTSQVTISPSALPRVHFDANNRCIVNGTPFFPIGIYGDVTSTTDLDRLKACGINTVLDTGMLSRSLTEQSDFLSALNSRSMMGVFSLKDIYDPLHSETAVDAWGSWTGVSNTIAGLVNANKGNQALLAWYINEDRTDDYLDQIRSTYSQITTLDPEHPCFQAIEGIQDYPAHAGIADITGFGTYPIWQRYNDNAYSADMPLFGSQTRVANKAGMYSRPVWMIAESGKFPQTPTSIAPTAQQMLCEAYQAIINGARGVFLNNLPNTKLDGEPQWQALETVAANLKAIAPIALGQDVAADEKATSSNANIECITRRVGDDVYILAVNTSSSTVSASFNVPEKLASIEGHAVDSGVPGASTQRIVMSSNILYDSISAVGTKAYRLTNSSYDILRESPKPNFKVGHTLPRLSWWLNGEMSFDVAKELTEHWGYALALGCGELTIPWSLANPDSYTSKACALAVSDPNKYPVFLLLEIGWTYSVPPWGTGDPRTEDLWCHLDGVNGTAATRTLTNTYTLTLDNGINASDMTVNANKTVSSLIPASGWIRIDSENLAYSSYTGSTFIISERGSFGTTPTSHASGTIIRAGTYQLYSPAAPTSAWKKIGEYWTTVLKPILEKFPTIKIPIAINGAEYGLPVIGPETTGSVVHWGQDIDVVSARNLYNAINGISGIDFITSWYRYISAQKARQDGAVASAYRAVLPADTHYITYLVAGDPMRRNSGVNYWGWDYAEMRSTTDYPSMESYYGPVFTWIGSTDLLTRATNQVAQQIPLGDPLSYDFVSAGIRFTRNTLAESLGIDDTVIKGTEVWTNVTPASGIVIIDNEQISYSSRDDNAKTLNVSARGVNGTIPAPHVLGSKIWQDNHVSDPEHFLGFLKMRFAMGMIGANSYYEIPADNDPNWLIQMQSLGQAQALYSHLEDYLRTGDLLVGNGNHRWSTDLPSYEFDTGDVWARVVVRKKRDLNNWLIAAWAQDGSDREVIVTIPTLGTVRVNARVAGSVYTAVLDGNIPVLTLVDTDPMNPTTGFPTN